MKNTEAKQDQISKGTPATSTERRGRLKWQMRIESFIDSYAVISRDLMDSK